LVVVEGLSDQILVLDIGLSLLFVTLNLLMEGRGQVLKGGVLGQEFSVGVATLECVHHNLILDMCCVNYGGIIS